MMTEKFAQWVGCLSKNLFNEENGLRKDVEFNANKGNIRERDNFLIAAEVIGAQARALHKLSGQIKYG